MHGLMRAGTLVILLVSLAAMLGAGVVRVFRFEGLSDYGEGTLLAVVERIDREPISPRWLEAPEITLAPYGPGYYFLAREVSHITPWEHSLIPGRLASLLAMWATALLIGIAAGRSGRSLEIGLMAGMAYLMTPAVHTWGTTYRVDSLATFFAVASCLAAGHGKKGLAASALLIVAGSLVKQTVALSAAGVFGWLLLERRYRDAAWYLQLVAGLGLSAWWTLNRATDGYYFASALAGNLGRMSPTRGLLATLDFLTSPLSVVTAWALWQRWGSRSESVEAVEAQPTRGWSRFEVALVLSTLLAGTLACKEGSAPCYFLEASALAALVFGCHGLPLVARRPKVFLAGLALLSLALAFPEVRFVREHWHKLGTVTYGQELVSTHVRAGDRVLADGQHLSAVLTAGASPVLNDPFYFRQMSDGGRISPSLLVDAITRGEIDKLVFKKSIAAHRLEIGKESQRWAESVLDAMEQHFELEAEMPELFIYRRRMAASTTAPRAADERHGASRR